MEFKNNKVCITGGSSGIGLQLAAELIRKNNEVIICGRSLKKLEEAKIQLPELHIFPCDISMVDECKNLVKWIEIQHSDCNIFINNAAIVHKTDFLKDERIIDKANAEFETNLLGPIRLSKLMMPIIEKNKEPKLINITTGLIYAPRAVYPFYNASKAALHSFTQVLRIQQKRSNIQIIEVLFPAVNTPWHNGNAPKIAITTEQAVREMISGLEKGKLEIKVGGVKILYLLSRIAPNFAIKKINNLSI